VTKRICPTCKNLHESSGNHMKCDYCLHASGRYATPEQSQSEADWAEHVQDHKHEFDYLTDGRCSEP
jgi:hypothetical protein